MVSAGVGENSAIHDRDHVGETGETGEMWGRATRAVEEAGGFCRGFWDKNGLCSFPDRVKHQREESTSSLVVVVVYCALFTCSACNRRTSIAGLKALLPLLENVSGVEGSLGNQCLSLLRWSHITEDVRDPLSTTTAILIIIIIGGKHLSGLTLAFCTDAVKLMPIFLFPCSC